jgi:hypothetical protein
LRKAVVDEERGATLEPVGERGNEGRGVRVQLGGRPFRERPRQRRPLVAVAIAPGEPGRCRAGADHAALAPGAAVEMDQIDGHGVEHLVADDDAVHALRQRVDPADAPGLLAHPLDRTALALPERGRDLDDRVAANAVTQ